MHTPTVFDPQTLSKRTREAIGAHRAAFAEAARESRSAVSVRVGSGAMLDLPPALARVVAAALAEVASGHAVEVRTVGEELSTQQAADLLGVSRPFLIGLLERGEIASWKVGSHRRVQRADVLAHRTRMRETATDALGKLADQAQALGLGYGTAPAR